MTTPRTTTSRTTSPTTGTDAPAAGTAATGRLLRTALLADAAVTGLNGAAYLLAAPVLDDLLGLPTVPLRGVGGFLLGFAVAVGAIGTRRTPRHGAVLTVVAVNLLWVVASVAAAVAGWGSPSTVGAVWIALQAAVVAAFAALQWLGLRARLSS
jgi:hypothetical protein